MGRDLVIVSHRGPVRIVENGNRERNAGGLVTALRDVVRHADETRWICAATSEADRRVAFDDTWLLVPLGGGECLVRMIPLAPRAHDAFYGRIANPLLWFVQHHLWDSANSPLITARDHDAWNRGYVAINEEFARTVSDPAVVPGGSIVMIHDYHFYLLPEMVRRARQDLALHFFVHIPWPQPDAWRVLPHAWRDAIFRGVLGSDIVGMQTERFVHNFLLGCEELLGLAVDFTHGSVRVDGREVAIRHYPISIDEHSLRELSEMPAVYAYARDIESNRRDHLIVRVDRTDPSKNIVRGFLAFDRMLELHPDLAERVTFLAVLQPSRQDVPEYSVYLERIHSVVADINARRGTTAWIPIDLRLVDDMALTVAAYQQYDALLVNSVFDGMNLVAKEGIIANQRDGVVLLSENTGAHEELSAVVLSINPFDVEEQAHALYDALMMPPAMRRARAEIATDIVRTNDVQKWLNRQLLDIELVRELVVAGFDRLGPEVATS